MDNQCESTKTYIIHTNNIDTWIVFEENMQVIIYIIH